MFQQFKHKIAQYTPLNDADEQFLEILVKKAATEKVAKHDVLLQQGDVSSYLYFINQGALMLRYIENQHEKACGFFFENDFAASFDSFAQQKTSDFYLQALTNAELLVWTYQDLIALNSHPSYYKIGHFLARELYINENRLKTMLIAYPSEKMYEVLHQEFPQIIQQVPLRYIAELMGITPEHLSRLRKKMAKGLN